MLIEHAHYLAQFMWVVGNAVWAMGELFDPAYDQPFQLWSRYSYWESMSLWLIFAIGLQKDSKHAAGSRPVS